jgi:hypothetical protein
MEIFLDTGQIATFPCHTWCNTFEPLKEALFIPERFQFMLYMNARKVKAVFNAKRQNLSKQRATITTNLNVPSKCFQARYVIFLFVAKCQTPYNVVEELVIPSAIRIASIIFHDKIPAQIQAVSAFDNSMHRRIIEMAAGVTKEVVE